jgi:hypothetical protein
MGRQRLRPARAQLTQTLAGVALDGAGVRERQAGTGGLELLQPPRPRGRPAEAVAGGVLALRLPLLPLPLSGDTDAGS